MGHGWPPVLRSLRMGLRPSLSIDVVTTVPGDMFTEMRAAFAAIAPGARGEVRAERAGAQGRADGAGDAPGGNHRWRVRRGVERPHGLADAGKQADIVIIDATSLNMAPIIDPVAAVVLSADVSNVDTVFVAGRPRSATASCWPMSTRLAPMSSFRDYLLEATAEKRQ
jgi:hypothetical protein